MHRVVFGVNCTYSGGVGQPYGRAVGTITIDVGGSGVADNHREYTLAEAVEQAARMVSGLGMNCESVTKLDTSGEQYKAIRRKTLVLQAPQEATP